VGLVNNDCGKTLLALGEFMIVESVLALQELGSYLVC
jgi:hypothetical protein